MDSTDWAGVFNSTSRREVAFRETWFLDFRRQWRRALADERWAFLNRLASVEEGQ